MTKTDIPDATVQTFVETEYWVEDPSMFALRVGEASVDLLNLHQLHGAESSTFVTAWNPRSTQLEESQNLLRNASLADDLRGECLHVYPGFGKHPSSGWQEASFLALGLSLERSRAIGEQWGQDAIVWSGNDGIPQLVLLR